MRRGSVESLSENRRDGGANTEIVPVPVLSERDSPVAKTVLMRLRYWCSSCSLSVDISRRNCLRQRVAVELMMVTCTRLVAPAAALSRFDQKLSICKPSHRSLFPIPRNRPTMEFVQSAPIHRVLCADCGTPIVPNGANLCVACLRNTIDITEGIPKQSSVAFCKNCERFLSPPLTWTIARPESQELLAICLKKLKGLNKVRLTEAHFIWTEPHSKRLRVSMTIQKEVRDYMRCFYMGSYILFSRS